MFQFVDKQQVCLEDFEPYVLSKTIHVTRKGSILGLYNLQNHFVLVDLDCINPNGQWPDYIVRQPEYFNLTDESLAMKCFVKRLNTAHWLSTGLGKSSINDL